MPTYHVLKELPKGQQPGDLVELNADEAAVFLAVGAVAALAEGGVVPAESEPVDKPKRQYRRRDLKAED